MKLKSASTLLLLSPMLAMATCPIQPTSRVLIGVDVSDSISPVERSVWLNTANQFIRCLGPGSRLELFYIDANTRNNAPIFDAEVPTQTSRTVDGIRRFMADRVRFRKQLEDALNKAFHSNSKSNKTDVFGLLDKAASDSPNEVVLFTDAYATEDLNLERMPIRGENIPSMINRVAALHRWSDVSLRGSNVWVILPGGAKQIGPNDRIALRSFYEPLFRALGSACLKRFEDHL